MKHFILLFTGLIILISCNFNQTSKDNSNEAKSILSIKKIIPLLVDVHVAEGYLERLKRFNDSLYMVIEDLKIVKSTPSLIRETEMKLKPIDSTLYNRVYKKHQTTPTQLTESLKYYSHQPMELDSIYTQVAKILKKEQVQIDGLIKK